MCLSYPSFRNKPHRSHNLCPNSNSWVIFDTAGFRNTSPPSNYVASADSDRFAGYFPSSSKYRQGRCSPKWLMPAGPQKILDGVRNFSGFHPMLAYLATKSLTSWPHWHIFVTTQPSFQSLRWTPISSPKNPAFSSPRFIRHPRKIAIRKSRSLCQIVEAFIFPWSSPAGCWAPFD